MDPMVMAEWPTDRDGEIICRGSSQDGVRNGVITTGFRGKSRQHPPPEPLKLCGRPRFAVSTLWWTRVALANLRGTDRTGGVTIGRLEREVR